MSDLPLPYHGAITLKSLLENPDLLNPPQFQAEEDKEKKIGDDLFSIARASSAAYLGGNIWDSTVSLDDAMDADNFKFEFMDLDEFLLENESAVNPDTIVPATGLSDQISVKVQPTSPPQSPVITPSPVSPKVTVEKIPIIRSEDLQLSPPQSPFLLPQTPGTSVKSGDEFSPQIEDIKLSSIPGEEDFDPRRRQFSEEELKPQPLIKKSKKVFVPEDRKDDRYWNRRRKNNVAAKRSRDARRIKENQIAMRASFLEKENTVLKAEFEKIKAENKSLKARLAKYER